MLKTDFKNYNVPDGKDYQIIDNGDGTCKIKDVTDYSATGVVKGDSYGATEINSANEQVNTNTTDIETEISRAKEAEKALQDAIDSSDTSIEEEVTRATKAEEQIASDLSSEITRAKGAEQQLTTDLTSETTRATDAEKTLTTNLASEVTRATKAEATITTNLNSEISRAKGEESTISTNLTNEISRAKKAEETLTTDLATEVSDRKKADTDLQTQIDAINSRSDVVDVVATKADLDAYSKDITVDDIIKVLQDETQSNATAYYRNTAKAKPYVWELIGVLGPYYTQAQVKKLVDDEAEARTTADTTLQGNINAEVSRAQNAESTLTNNLTAEVTRAKGAEETLTNDLSSEVTRAKAKEAELETAIKACYTKDEIDALLENLIEINK